LVLAILAVGWGCGGGQKTGASSPGDEVAEEYDDGDISAEVEGADGEDEAPLEEPGMVPPEKYDALRRAMDHKRPAMSRCFAKAIEDGKLAVESKGTVTVGLTVTEAGAARDVKITRSTLKSDAVEECMIEQVHEMKFTTLPSPVEFTFTYQFERDY